MITNEDFRQLIERGDVDGLRRALASDPALANRTIVWIQNQQNESDPLHYVSDCVSQARLTDGVAGEIATLLLAHGAAIEGTQGRESPLIAAASLGAATVARILIDAGAQLERTSIFGARALHWAAWTGEPAIVGMLITHGASIEPECSEFGASPLFWAVHGYGPHGPAQKSGQIDAARLLIQAGANIDTCNKQGVSAIEMATHCPRDDMHELLIEQRSRPE